MPIKQGEFLDNMLILDVLRMADHRGWWARMLDKVNVWFWGMVGA